MHIVTRVGNQHQSLDHASEPFHRLRRANSPPTLKSGNVFPLFEEVLNGKSLICTQVTRTVPRRFGALWKLFLDEICDGVFDCDMRKKLSHCEDE